MHYCNEHTHYGVLASPQCDYLGGNSSQIPARYGQGLGIERTDRAVRYAGCASTAVPDQERRWFGMQMTALSIPGQYSATYNYSSTQNNGKITTQVDNGETVSYTYDARNRLIAASSSAAPFYSFITPYWIYSSSVPEVTPLESVTSEIMFDMFEP